MKKLDFMVELDDLSDIILYELLKVSVNNYAISTDEKERKLIKKYINKIETRLKE